MTESTITTPASNAGSPERADAPVAGGASRRAAGLSGMLLPELKQMAGGLGIKGVGGMRKSQLIDAIKAAQGGQSNSQPAGRSNGAAAKASAPAEARSEQKPD